MLLETHIILRAKTTPSSEEEKGLRPRAALKGQGDLAILWLRPKYYFFLEERGRTLVNTRN